MLLGPSSRLQVLCVNEIISPHHLNFMSRGWRVDDDQWHRDHSREYTNTPGQFFQKEHRQKWIEEGWAVHVYVG